MCLDKEKSIINKRKTLLSGELLIYIKHIRQSIVQYIVGHTLSDDTVFMDSNR